MTDIHPEYQAEAETLQRTLLAIEAALSRQTTTYFEGGGNNYTNRMLNQGLREDILTQLQEHGHDPYFARLDFEDARGDQCVYFGHAHLGRVGSHPGQILDWRCDLYSLFLGGNAPQQRYRVKATGREHQVHLRLKRRLEIDDRHLWRVTDTVDHRAATQARRAPQPTAVRTASPVAEIPTAQDEFLIRKLTTRGDPRLQDIVATIQADQDAIIRAPLDAALLLHGVAGSGKTSIAYHRLAYLMFTDHGYDLKPEQLLVVGPNRTFLSYVRDLLPSLGVTGIPQVTFSEWIWERLSKVAGVGPVTFTDAVASALDDRQGRPEHRTRLWNSARLRGSLRFRELIERHVARLTERAPLPTQELSLTLRKGDDEKRFTLTPADILAVWNALPAELPLATRREQLIEQAIKTVTAAYTRLLDAPQTKDDAASLTNARRATREHLQANWKRLSLPDVFEDMFQPGHLPEIARGLFTPEEQRLLRSTRPSLPGGKTPRQRTVDISDLAGLAVLSERLYGTQGRSYRHLVVDEAQDFSPLQLHVLTRACPTGSMTVVGDTAQSIHAYRGIEDWQEFDGLLPAAKVVRHLITQNYRSTQELVAFSNVLLRTLRGDRALESRVIHRTGPRPVMVATANAAQHDAVLSEAVRSRVEAGHPSVAVITPDSAGAAAVTRVLDRAGLAHTVVTEGAEMGPDDLRGIVVVPAALCKGLEFAAVIVPEASDERYPSGNAYAGSLLYVAVSRALHALQLLTVDRFSGWLEEAQASADTDFSRLPRPPLKWTGVTLSQQIRATRAKGTPFADIADDVERRIHALVRGGQGSEVLEAYDAFGQLGSLTFNDVLIQSSAQDPAAFVHRALVASLPEALRDTVKVQLESLEQTGHRHAPAFRQQYERLLNPPKEPTTPVRPVAVPVRPTPTTVPADRLQTLARPLTQAALKQHLGKDAQPLPKKTRKELVRHRDEVLREVGPEHRAVVAAGIEFNMFTDFTAQIARVAYRVATGQHLDYVNPPQTFTKPTAVPTSDSPRVQLTPLEMKGIQIGRDRILAGLPDSKTRAHYVRLIRDNSFSHQERLVLLQVYRRQRPDLALAMIAPRPDQLTRLRHVWQGIRPHLSEPERTRLSHVIAYGQFTSEDAARLQQLAPGIWAL